MSTTASSLEKSGMFFAHRTRFIVLILGLMFIMFTNSNYNTITFSVICMEDVVEEQSKNTNETHWLETSSKVSAVFSAGAVGAIVGLIPSVPFTNLLGIRVVLSFYGIVASLATLLMPLAVEIGYFAVIVMRFCQGFGTSILFSSIGSISEGWSPITEISTYVAILSAGFQISNIILMPAAGILCDSDWGWRSIYYIFGGSATLFNILFFFFFTDRASMHRNVSKKELAIIDNGRVENNAKSVPYLAICKDKVVLSVWLTAVGGNLSMMCLIIYGPTYLNKVLHLDVKETGFSNAIPYILAALVKFICGPLSDALTFIPDVWRVVFFAAVSQGGVAIGYFVMALTNTRIVAQIAYTWSIVMLGVNVVGVVKCAQLRARHHVHFVMAVISFSAWIAVFILPIVVSFMCPDNLPEQWSRFFIVVGIWVVVMNVPFPFFASVEAADYTKPEFSQKVTPEVDVEK
ncbi:unnamed protein product [Caenorhabditis angaria]|uniref:Major facilitator superfamily (MFS) profile domain-containing protein n=1 Tax=Caenorhabditis angaria TaxID=860376 RepID=A0A9P1ICS0_9PELO|nr:unnamed protein product [Caenorhabditis angaria]